MAVTSQARKPSPFQVRRQVLHELHLVIRSPLVLARVALDPRLHHVPIERDAGDLLAAHPRPLDLGDLVGDELQRVRTLRQFRQVVDRGHEIEDLLWIPSRQVLRQVGADLVLVER